MVIGSRRCAVTQPTLKRRNPVFGPAPVARHGPFLQRCHDRRPVSDDVVPGPQIERSQHRRPILFTKQRLDVGTEAERSVGGRLVWHRNVLPEIVVQAVGRILIAREPIRQPNLRPDRCTEVTTAAGSGIQL
jgi:hypothetical protein